jgi:hypothetical protein
MNNIHQLQHSRARFNIVSAGLVLLTSGLLIAVNTPYTMAESVWPGAHLHCGCDLRRSFQGETG